VWKWKWNGKNERESNCFDANASLVSFVFILKNPHNVPVRRFGLKAEVKDRAISFHSPCDPYFCDIGVFTDCNVNATSDTWLDCTYSDNTGLDGRMFITGLGFFQVREIEVFENTD
jgi:hypothetical protein